MAAIKRPGAIPEPTIDLRPAVVVQEPASLAHQWTERVTNRARFVSWTVRQPKLKAGPTFRIGPRARVVLMGEGRIDRGERLVIAEDFSCVAQAPITIGEDVYINRGVYVCSFAGVRIGDRCRIGERVSIHDENHLPLDPDGPDSGYRAAPVDIGDDVWLGANTVVLSGVRIGRGTVVGSGSVVTKDLPGGVLAAGSPAVVVKHLGLRDERRASVDR